MGNFRVAMERVGREYNSVKTGPIEDTGQYSDESRGKDNLLRDLALYGD